MALEEGQGWRRTVQQSLADHELGTAQLCSAYAEAMTQVLVRSNGCTVRDQRYLTASDTWQCKLVPATAVEPVGPPARHSTRVGTWHFCLASLDDHRLEDIVLEKDLVSSTVSIELKNVVVVSDPATLTYEYAPGISLCIAQHRAAQPAQSRPAIALLRPFF